MTVLGLAVLTILTILTLMAMVAVMAVMAVMTVSMMTVSMSVPVVPLQLMLNSIGDGGSSNTADDGAKLSAHELLSEKTTSAAADHGRNQTPFAILLCILRTGRSWIKIGSVIVSRTRQFALCLVLGISWLLRLVATHVRVSRTGPIIWRRRRIFALRWC
jgi:hypothetical protein